MATWLEEEYSFPPFEHVIISRPFFFLPVSEVRIDPCSRDSICQPLETVFLSSFLLRIPSALKAKKKERERRNSTLSHWKNVPSDRCDWPSYFLARVYWICKGGKKKKYTQVSTVTYTNVPCNLSLVYVILSPLTLQKPLLAFEWPKLYEFRHQRWCYSQSVPYWQQTRKTAHGR